MSKTFRQYDKRWGHLKYPRGNDTMANSGCGATACASLYVNNPKYQTYTPITTRKYMVSHGYAIAGQGTAWAGIKACMERYGFKAEMILISKSSDMNKVYKKLKSNGFRKGIFLFRGGTAPSKVTWTTGGHFVAFSEYKYDAKKKRHKFYTRDSSPRKNDGWHSYERDMAGLVVAVWVVTLKRTTKTKFLYASTMYASQVEKSPWHYSNKNSKKSWASAKKNHIINCARLMSFVMQYAGIIPKGTAVYVQDGKLKGDKAAISALKNSKAVTILHPNKSVKNAGLKEGDIIGLRNHMMMYRGKNSKGHRRYDSAGGSDMKAHNCTKRVRTHDDDSKVYIIIRPKDK